MKPGLLPPGLDKFNWSTVVGVVSNARQFALQMDPPPAAYIPVSQSWPVAPLRASMTVLLRTAGDPARAAQGLRQMVAALDRDQPIGRITPMTGLVAESLQVPRFNTILLGLFAGLAFALAVVGIYGVVAWNVTQRTREFGIRQALGARSEDVLRLVIVQGMRVVLLGLLLGLVGSLAVARTLQSMLFAVSTFDPWTFGAVALGLATVALLACLVPARRATRVDPSTALRAE
jgi:putative ABC transport system permease protein